MAWNVLCGVVPVGGVGFGVWLVVMMVMMVMKTGLRIGFLGKQRAIRDWKMKSRGVMAMDDDFVWLDVETVMHQAVCEEKSAKKTKPQRPWWKKTRMERQEPEAILSAMETRYPRLNIG